MTKFLPFFILTLICHATCVANDGIKDAVADAESFLFECEELHDRFLMIANISVESSPDSPILFSAKGKMQECYTPKFSLQEVRWSPEIFDDLVNLPGQTREFAFNVPANHKFFQVGERKLAITDEGLRDIGLSEMATHNAQCLRAFDWPFANYPMFCKEGENGIARLIFSKKDRCFYASVGKDGVIDSFWKRGDAARSYSRCFFKDGLVIRSELYYAGKDFKPEDKAPDMKMHVLYSAVETKWKSFGAGHVPERIHANFTRGTLGESWNFNLEAELQFFDSNSQEFKLAESQIRELSTKVPAKKQ